MTASKLSLRAYAAHRREKSLPGQTHTAVRKAITEGRLEKSVERVGRRWFIDAALADREWAKKSDATQQRDPKAPKAPLYDGEPDHLDLGRGKEGEEKDSSPTLNELQRRRLAMQTEVTRLELEEKNGKLVPAAQVKRRAFETARIARDRMFGIIDRVDARLAPKLSRTRVRAILREEIEKACRELAGGLE